METPDILDMGDYMEVVMTYKCRFCTYVCSTIQEMGTHVKDAHLKSGSTDQDLASQEGETVPGSQETTARMAGEEETEGTDNV